jgi:hypothetical protein
MYVGAENSTGTTFGIGTAYAGVVYVNGANPLAFATSGAERMRLTASGNLGIGTSSPGAKLHVVSASTSLAQFTGPEYAQIRHSDGTRVLYTQVYNNQARLFTESATPLLFGTTDTERMRLDSSGNLGLGASSITPIFGRTLQIGSGATEGSLSIVGSTGSGYVATVGSVFQFTGRGGMSVTFGTNDVERARIDSSGNLLVGTTGRNEQDSNSFSLDVQSKAMYVNHANGTSSGNGYVLFGYNAVNIGSITQSGTTAVLYNVTSDQRLKENIVDAPEFGSVIDSIKVRSYDWKTDQTHQRAGFIAQELVTVAPEAVHQPADPEAMMAVDYSKLVPMLVKEIQSLRARVAALESI